ncbi:MAG: DoxX family protein [Methylococcales bacterium]|nr:DoxX family protein [Methylococcales bacterium]
MTDFDPAKVCQNPVIGTVMNYYHLTGNWLEQHSDQWPPLLLRLILAYEFWEAGIEKLHGSNWFGQVEFPFPFSLLSTDLLWFMGTWMELLGAVALVLGLGTRFFVFGLMVLTLVAAKVIHWPKDWNTLAEFWQGYAISNKGHGNFKLPLLYLIMFMPLLFGGAGRWSLDAWLQKRMRHCQS